MKRILLCLLAAVMLTAAVPLRAQAVLDEKQALRQRIAADYYAACQGSGKESLGGFCGLMTSWQLYLMGINKYLITNDGNRQYDYYSALRYTTGGYRIKAYPAREYTLKEALYTATDYGTQDAYNLVVGFQWTNTEAGATYGHAVVIYAILDGMVYFTEGFQTSFGSAEGQAVVLSISDFARYYDDWTIFEGVIEFGKRDLALQMERYPAHFYGTVLQSANLYSQILEDPDGGRPLRAVSAGERLYITGLLEDEFGQCFYQVDDSGTEGYISAELVSMLQLCSDDIAAVDAAAPNTLKPGESFSLSGTVLSEHSRIAQVEAVVTDEMGNVKFTYVPEEKDGVYTIGGAACDEAMDFSSLAEGEYHYVLYATSENHYVSDGKITCSTSRLPLVSETFYIGDVPKNLQVEAVHPRVIPDGWSYFQGQWYYYKDGSPYVGWLTDNEVDYYLQEDGSITTGWAVINGKERFFSNTGALRTGWVEKNGQRSYLLRNGVQALGWREIDGKRYFFGSSGVMQRNGWAKWNGFRYYIRLDGTAVTDGWYDLPEGRFFFHADGRALMQSVEEEGEYRIVLLGRNLRLRAKCLLES